MRSLSPGSPSPGLASASCSSTTIDAALGAVSNESSGVSSAVLQAFRMVGGALGAAILGALINATYRDQLDQAVSPTLARPARESAVAGIDPASAAHSPHLLGAVREAFVSGMNLTLLVSAALIAASAVLALAFRPRATAAPFLAEPQATPQEADVISARPNLNASARRRDSGDDAA
jgi:MFS transporter, DHA2 family, multidrug resistance protein